MSRAYSNHQVTCPSKTPSFQALAGYLASQIPKCHWISDCILIYIAAEQICVVPILHSVSDLRGFRVTLLEGKEAVF